MSSNMKESLLSIHGQLTECLQEIHLPAPSIDGESESENESKTPDLTAEIRSGTLNSEHKLTAGNNGAAVDRKNVRRKVVFRS
uniref:Uncharacterized protein n=1 Tax=Noccaea caerulescens TaxID=107243 RepID=A0A1J3CI55_NOCCA